ncbi:hypothetical protein E2562_011926 [Oryza meyeriana var. granulata]|uniref:Uncharacterized protein n=1 Tax=Oryza meyeriana var. granulata TaxID=110450 RepID=A0A6G1CE19_9ORYZ|nr:hypothetical protein E2562_011926 [Oryza meyeriana var. granulata]
MPHAGTALALDGHRCNASHAECCRAPTTAVGSSATACRHAADDCRRARAFAPRAPPRSLAAARPPSPQAWVPPLPACRRADR